MQRPLAIIVLCLAVLVSAQAANDAHAHPAAGREQERSVHTAYLPEGARMPNIRGQGQAGAIFDLSKSPPARRLFAFISPSDKQDPAFQVITEIAQARPTELASRIVLVCLIPHDSRHQQHKCPVFEHATVLHVGAADLTQLTRQLGVTVLRDSGSPIYHSSNVILTDTDGTIYRRISNPHLEKAEILDWLLSRSAATDGS